MDWRDEGILLSVRGHGESSAIIDVLTAGHGRQSGLVRGGLGQTMAPVLQPGAQLSVEWRGRLEEHLGNFRVEPLKPRAAALMEDRATLGAFNAMSALLLAFVQEREADGDFYEATHDLVEELAARHREWPGTYVRWEAVALARLGFGLDLDRCAVTGTRQDLAYVSPRTGRAVSREAGGPWADKLLALPPFLIGEGSVNMGAVRQGMALTGWFLKNSVCPAMGRERLPEARDRLASLFERHRMPAAPEDEPRDYERLSLWCRRLGISRAIQGPQEALKL